MNLSRGQAGYNSNHYEQYKFTVIPVENHDGIVSHTKLVSKRARVLLVRKEALQHLRTVRIHTFLKNSLNNHDSTSEDKILQQTN